MREITVDIAPDAVWVADRDRRADFARHPDSSLVVANPQRHIEADRPCYCVAGRPVVRAPSTIVRARLGQEMDTGLDSVATV